MKTNTNRIARMTAFAIGLGLMAMTLNAQQGSFNLPVRAHWGTATLAPGEHRVEVPLPLGTTIVYLRGERNSQVTVPLLVERTESSNHSYLRLVRVNGEYYVAAYQAGPAGERFDFPTPKQHKGSLESEQATLVEVSGN